jgi:hypothetical protein
MDPRTTTSGRHGRTPFLRRRPPAAVRRPGLFLGVAAAGALAFNVVVGTEPAAQAEPAAAETVSVAEQLGLTARSGPADLTEDLDPLEDLAATRSAREAAQTAAAQTQAAADRAELERQQAEAKAKAKAKAEAKAKAAAAAKAAAEAAAEQAESAEAAEAAGSSGSSGSAEAAPVAEEASAPAAAAAASTAVSAIAQIANSAGPISARAQAAANAVVSNVPGASGIHLGGTRPSAADPAGHPSGNAVDYMVNSDSGLGDAIVEYHIANWDALGVEYIIWQQRYLSSPGGSWSYMEDRGSPTANHMDHPHVNYQG